jgi:threonine dehydrogenase-like Zn-dependent dehydrogenase
VKRAILYGARDLRIEDCPLNYDRLEPDQLYVQTEITALSTGTDLGNFLGNSAYVPGAPGYPRPVGYSNVGVVRKVGSAVRGLEPSQRIFSTRPHQSAFLARQGDLLLPIPQGVASDVASLSYLTHLGLAALRQALYQTGENVAVIGLGVIGLCCTALAKAMGARVAAIANSDLRLDLARRIGADLACKSDDPGLAARLGESFGETGIDIIILTANSWNAYRQSLEIVRLGGRICLLGFPGRDQRPPEFNPLDPQWVYAKQLAIFGSGYAPQTDCSPADLRFNTRRNLQYILDLMASGILALGPIISHRLPAARMHEAYELAANHSKELVSAIFKWDGT